MKKKVFGLIVLGIGMGVGGVLAQACENGSESDVCLKAGVESSSVYMQADKDFTYRGNPISPKIIEAMVGWLSDSVDPVVSVDLGANQSNQFGCNAMVDGTYVYYERGGRDGSFGYTHIGRTDSGVHVISTSDCGGGSGTFRNIMLLVIQPDQGVVLDDEKEALVTSPRLLIKNFGSVCLGDRWSGELRVDGDYLIIGKDEGRFAQFEGAEPSVTRRLKIEIGR